MKSARFCPAILCLVVSLVAGCGGKGLDAPVISAPCAPSTKPEFAYILTGYAVSMYTIDSCTGQFIPTTPASVLTGYFYPQNPSSEEMVADPLGRFAYVANPVSNATSLSTVSMFAINSTTGVLTPTSPATVPTGFYPQEIAIDPLGRFVYTANSDDATVSMFTINQTTGVLTPTSPASVSTMVPGNILSIPSFLTIDPAGKFLYLTASLTNNAAVLMFSINQTTGLLTPTSPASVLNFGTPFQVVVSPNGKFAYVVNNFSGGAYTNGVGQYTVNSTTGVLTPNTPAYVSAGNGPTEIAVDPTSHFAYVVNRSDSSVSMYTIDPSTGNLTLNTGPTHLTGVVGTGNEPFRITFDPSGAFVYVTNETAAVSIYTVNTDGSLAPDSTTGVAGLATAIAK